MKKKNLMIIGIIIILITILLVTLLMNKKTEIRFENGKKLYVKVADKQKEIEKGLMNVKEIKENEGMLFVFQDEQIRYFWMKNTLIDLDIIFLNENKEIVSVQTMRICKEEPCMQYSSNGKAKYAIETNAGFTKENRIYIAQKVEFEN